MASPWPFGSVSPPVAWILTVVALAAGLGVALAQARRGATLPTWPLWPVAALLGVAALQLVPMPTALHELLAPGSAKLWHPADAVAAAVLGGGWRPVSLHPEATRRSLGLVTALTALAVFSIPALRERRRALAAALAVILSGLAVALYGVVARTLFGPLLYGRLPVPTVSPFGPFVSKNHFAGYVEMAALLALGLAVGLADEARRGASGSSWMQTRFAGRVVFAAAAAAAMALGVLVSLSRGGAISLLLGVLAFAGLRLVARSHAPGRRRRALTIVAAAAGLFGVLLLLLPLEARERIFTLAGATRDPAGAFRLDLWRDTLRLWTRSPLLGFGQGAYADALSVVKTLPVDLRAEHAENDYLELLAEGGLAGLGFAVLAIGLGARQLLSRLRRQTDRLQRGLGLGAGAALVALLVHGAFDFNLHIPSNALLFAFLAALAMAGVSEESPAGEKARWVPVAALAAALLMAAAPPSRAARVSELESVSGLLEGPGPLRLRWAQADLALTAWLRRRPADAEGWVVLGWVRALRGQRAEGADLARYGSSLDRHRQSLQVEADRLKRLVTAP